MKIALVYVKDTSKHRLTSAVCYCKQHDRQRASPFLKNLLLRKIFSGALIDFGVLGAFFTRKSPPK